VADWNWPVLSVVVPCVKVHVLSPIYLPGRDFIPAARIANDYNFFSPRPGIFGRPRR
jgi:hypothetical protein